MNEKSLSSRARFRIKTLIKALISGALIAWLVLEGRLDFAVLGQVYSEPTIIFFAASVWCIGICAIGTIRWMILLRGVGLSCRFGRCCALNVVGAFFNTVLLGSVGGDVVRALYAFRDNRNRGRALPMMTVILDRLTGLYGLFILGMLGMLINYDEISAKPILAPIFMFVVFVFFGLTLGLVGILSSPSSRVGVLYSVILQSRFVPRFARSALQAFRSYHDARGNLWSAILLSIAGQAQLILFYWYLTPKISLTSLPLALQAMVVSVGSLLTAIPIAPGGFGVGHAAFDKLFGLVGVENGANIFNVVIVGQMALNLIGFVPYLFLRTSSYERSKSGASREPVEH